MTGTDARLAAAAVAVVLIAGLLAKRPRPRPVVHHNAAGPVTLGLIALTAVVVYLKAHHPAAPAAAKVAPRPVVTHTTIVQHVSSHPLLTGWQIVAIVVVTLVVAMVLELNRRGQQ